MGTMGSQALGLRLAMLRERLEASKEDVAMFLGVTLDEVEAIEGGRRLMATQTERLSDLYGVPVDELIDDGHPVVASWAMPGFATTAGERREVMSTVATINRMALNLNEMHRLSERA